MEEGLSLDNILGAGDIENLFLNDDIETQETPPENGEETKETEETTEVNTDTLFEEPESVGSEENTKEKDDTTSNEGGTSPYSYSSIAKAFAEEGIIPSLTEELINEVKDAEGLRKLVDALIKSEFDERTRRVDEALSVGVEPDKIRQYENAINYLDLIEDEAISDESEKGETLRKQLIYQDFVNRGYSKERAQREIKKSFDAGTDIEDAKEALKGNKEFFEGLYSDLIKEAKELEEEFNRERKKLAEDLKKDILEGKDAFGEIQMDKSTRLKIFDNLSKPIYKDPDTGEYYTAIQKYEKENRQEFLKNVGILFTLTDGFKNLNGLVKSKVNKEMKKGFKELEHVLNNTARTSDGNIKFSSGVDEQPESYIGKGLKLDI